MFSIDTKPEVVSTCLQKLHHVLYLRAGYSKLWKMWQSSHGHPRCQSFLLLLRLGGQICFVATITNLIM